MYGIINFLRKKEIKNPPWDYDFLINLEESEYPLYLAKLFKLRTGEELPLLKEWGFKGFVGFHPTCCRAGICPSGQGFRRYIIDKKRCKTFNQKIQWIKLYGITDLMRDCTDKVKVRDYVSEKIGDEYLKPVLQVVRSEESGVRRNNLNFSLSTLNTPLFDKIDFEKLPNSFVIKCNHGCKWQYIIKKKSEFLKTDKLFELVKRNITGWLEQEYWGWNGFEMQYKNIEPKILIEQFMSDDFNSAPVTLNVYCSEGIPKITVKFQQDNTIFICDENLKPVNDIFIIKDWEKAEKVSFDYINQSIDLSKKLSKDFNFVRVDWMVYQNKLYFEELTFTPYSGFVKFKDKKSAIKAGKIINLGE